MKKLIVLIALAAAMLIPSAAHAEKLSGDGWQYQELEGSEVRIARQPDMDSDTAYVVDFEDNIVGGPYVFASDNDSYVHAESEDGSTTVFDHDGSVLVTVPDGYTVISPSLGMYAVYNNEDDSKPMEFKLYDYETRELLHTFDGYIFFYLEQRRDRMCILKNDKYAVVDDHGNFYSDYVYDSVPHRFNLDYEPYPKSYAIVTQDGREMYIDENLNEIDPADYNGGRFITQYYPAQTANIEYSDRYYTAVSGEDTALIDAQTGEYIIPFQSDYKGFIITEDNYIITQNNGQSGILDFDGNVVVPFEYDGIYLTNPDGKSEFAVISKHTDGWENGLFRGGKILQYGDMMDLKPVGNGIFVNTYPDPNESYEYAHNYTDTLSEIVDIAGHNLTGEIYNGVNVAGGEFYTSKEYHSSPEEYELTYVPSDFAVISLNGEYLDFDGVIRDARTLVPMREIIEGLGGTVDWDGDTRTVNTEIDGITIEITIDSDVMYVNGEAVTLDVPAQLINEKTMLPVRALSENVGFNVDWDDVIRCVYITK